MVRKIALICIKDKRLLIVHKKTIDMFISPGGKIDEGESDEDCLRREINEELGCDAGNFIYYDTYFDKAAEGFDLELKCYFGEIYGKIKLNPKDNIDGYLWIDRNYDKSLKLANLLEKKIIPGLIDKGLM